MTIDTNATIQPPAADTAARAQEIRRRLPGQARRQRLDTARLEYGPLYSLAGGADAAPEGRVHPPRRLRADRELPGTHSR